MLSAMRCSVALLLHALLLVTTVGGSAVVRRSSGFEFETVKRQASANGTTGLQVDLGYAIYEGFTNETSKINNFLGIRFADPPTGNLRWQLPQAPTVNRSEVQSAKNYSAYCPQSGDSSPSAYFIGGGDEDCLFLNVWSPTNASNLPVFVWIHGGGYGAGDGQQDLQAMINGNDNGFVGVAIQYRLGAFGFLAGDEVSRNGVVNAGLLDQQLALQWVQSYIHLFGGNASQVTIGGLSAGGGSVMLHDIAYGGTQGNKLFVNTIAASPYLPMQYGYKDWVPSQAYYAFATAAGCAPTHGYGFSSQTIFDCLVEKDSLTLQYASSNISTSVTYGTWAFLPVTDGVFIQQLPSQQLTQKQLNGQRMLTGNNANEGPGFTPQTITTEDDLVAWLEVTFPMFTNDDIAKVLLYYPSSNASVDPNAPEYATNGLTGATAVNESQVGTGQQQRADNIYAETTFVCPSYWLAEAYTSNGRTAYKYQYSIPVGTHAVDSSAVFGPATPNQSPEFSNAYMRIWGNFIMKNDPSIPTAVANGNSSGSANPASDWPAFHVYAPYMINLNETGGTPYEIDVLGDGTNETQFEEPGLVNSFEKVNAWTWEGGRGYRCDFWKQMGILVPE